MAMHAAEQVLGGWGGCPVEKCVVQRPESVAELGDILATAREGTFIARGLGRSYGDAALNRQSGVISQVRLNRLLAFDESRGILHCEAGVSLAEIIAIFLPRGWQLPVVPGTKFVTAGGAIAADVHGKNHHASGSFGNFVLDLELLTASGEVIRCSAGEHADVFWATIGGMGLTGIILSARIQLCRAATAYCDVTYRRTQNVDEALALLEATERDYRHSVAWLDCQAKGAKLGRSVLMLANEAEPGQLPAARRATPLSIPRRRERSVPPGMPGWLINPWSVRAFNALYYAAHRQGRQIVDYDSFFFPLDRIRNWNRLYGRRGFVQYQAFFPAQTSRRGIIELLERVAASGRASFLAVLKSCGPGNPGLLSYLGRGHTLALDFKNTGEDLRRLLNELDEQLLRHGGRLYLAKDASTSAARFQAMYPRLAEFQAIKARLDPQCRFSSSQARRLGIVPGNVTVSSDKLSARPERRLPAPHFAAQLAQTTGNKNLCGN